MTIAIALISPLWFPNSGTKANHVNDYSWPFRQRLMIDDQKAALDRRLQVLYQVVGRKPCSLRAGLTFEAPGERQ